MISRSRYRKACSLLLAKCVVLGLLSVCSQGVAANGVCAVSGGGGEVGRPSLLQYASAWARSIDLRNLRKCMVRFAPGVHWQWVGMAPNGVSYKSAVSNVLRGDYWIRFGSKSRISGVVEANLFLTCLLTCITMPSTA